MEVELWLWKMEVGTSEMPITYFTEDFYSFKNHFKVKVPWALRDLLLPEISSGNFAIKLIFTMLEIEKS